MSRFRVRDAVVFDNSNTYGFWFNKPLDVAASSYYVTKEFEFNPVALSEFFYNNSSYFWAIVAVNKPSDIFRWPKAGEVILIPNINTIRHILSDQ